MTNQLPPAPWIVRPATFNTWEVVDADGNVLLCVSHQYFAQAIVDWRNAEAVQLQNPHWLVHEGDNGSWICDPRSEVFHVGPTPTAAILAAAKWLEENKEKSK